MEKAAKSPNRLVEIWLDLGSIYNVMDRTEEAETCFLAALRYTNQVKLLKKEFVLFPVYQELAKLFMKREQHDKALKTLKEAVR